MKPFKQLLPSSIKDHKRERMPSMVSMVNSPLPRVKSRPTLVKLQDSRENSKMMKTMLHYKENCKLPGMQQTVSLLPEMVSKINSNHS